MKDGTMLMDVDVGLIWLETHQMIKFTSSIKWEKSQKIMSNKFRLSSGGQINRTERISFKFNGKTFYGFKGDTLASALLANGVHLVGRSFKYHRPRGIFSSGAEETNALVQVIKDKGKTDPNIRATQIEIFEGFNAESQNCWPTVNFDLGAINSLFSPYYSCRLLL